MVVAMPIAVNTGSTSLWERQLDRVPALLHDIHCAGLKLAFELPTSLSALSLRCADQEMRRSRIAGS